MQSFVVLPVTNFSLRLVNILHWGFTLFGTVAWLVDITSIGIFHVCISAKEERWLVVQGMVFDGIILRRR